jgi:hypothetical protein
MADEVRPLVTSAPAVLQVVDHAPAAAIAPHFEDLTTSPSSELAAELCGAVDWLGVKVEEILLAALGRALGATRGEGAVCVDVTGAHRWLFHTVSLICSSSHPMTPTEMLQGAHTALAAAPARSTAQSEVLLNLDGADRDEASTARVLELKVRRTGGLVQFDWRYDATRFEAYSIEELAEQLPLALIEITSDAAAPL